MIRFDKSWRYAFACNVAQAAILTTFKYILFHPVHRWQAILSAMPSLATASSLALLASFGITFSAAEPIQLDFKKSIVNVPAFQKRADGTVVGTLNQDQFKSMYTLVSTLLITLCSI
jgi:hypothetical protein